MPLAALRAELEVVRAGDVRDGADEELRVGACSVSPSAGEVVSVPSDVSCRDAAAYHSGDPYSCFTPG